MKTKLLITMIVTSLLMINLHAQQPLTNTGKSPFVQVVKDIWDNIDKFAIFIKQDDDINEHFKNIETRIRANLPLLLMILGSGSAIKKLDKIVDKIEKMNFGYETIRYEEKEKTNKKIVLLLKQNVD